MPLQSENKKNASDTPFINFPVTMDSGNMKLIPRFIAQDFVEKLEKGTKLTIGEDKFKRDATSSRWLKITDDGQEQDVDNDLSKIIQGETQLTLDGVQYFKRGNAGGKARWFKIAGTEPKQPEGGICNAQEIESSAHSFFLQALLIQMDSVLHKFFEDNLDEVMPIKLF